MRIHLLLAGIATVVSWCVASAQASKDPCNTDLSLPLDAYLCSEAKLSVAKQELSKLLSETVKAFPKQRTKSALISQADVLTTQVAWSKYVKINCALEVALPGSASDWHYPAANENFCLLRETTSRIETLKKWKVCAIEGGSICLP